MANNDQPDDLVDFLGGAVGRNKTQWGPMAFGAATGYLAGREIRNLMGYTQQVGPQAYYYEQQQQGYYDYAQQAPMPPQEMVYYQPSGLEKAVYLVFNLVKLLFGLAILSGLGWLIWQVVQWAQTP